jgi:hypothetical protein
MLPLTCIRKPTSKPTNRPSAKPTNLPTGNPGKNRVVTFIDRLYSDILLIVFFIPTLILQFTQSVSSGDPTRKPTAKPTSRPSSKPTNSPVRPGTTHVLTRMYYHQPLTIFNCRSVSFSFIRVPYTNAKQSPNCSTHTQATKQPDKKTNEPAHSYSW